MLNRNARNQASEMSLSEWEYLIPLNEASWESDGFHATNPFARDIEELSTLSTQTEIATPEVITDIFLDNLMSDNLSNVEQNSRIAQSSQQSSSQASSDSAELANETPMNRNNV